MSDNTPSTPRDEQQRDYYRDYYRRNPDKARRNYELTRERAKKDQIETAKAADRHFTKWEPDEDDQLREMYPTHTQKDIALILGRTIRSVQLRAKTLGLRKNARRSP